MKNKHFQLWTILLVTAIAYAQPAIRPYARRMQPPDGLYYIFQHDYNSFEIIHRHEFLPPPSFDPAASAYVDVTAEISFSIGQWEQVPEPGTGNDDEYMVWGVGPEVAFWELDRDDSPPCLNCYGPNFQYLWWAPYGDFQILDESEIRVALQNNPTGFLNGWEFVRDGNGDPVPGAYRTVRNLRRFPWATTFGPARGFVGGVVWAAHHSGGGGSPASNVRECTWDGNHQEYVCYNSDTDGPDRTFFDINSFDYRIKGPARNITPH